MNYVELINWFWEKDLEYNFSDKEIALYSYLLKVSNSISWKNPFGQSNDMIIAKFGWGKTSFNTAKNTLKLAGLIDFRAGNGRSNIYQYTLKQKGVQKSTLSVPLSDTLSDTLSKQKPSSSLNINLNINKETSKKKIDLSFVDEKFIEVMTTWLEYKKTNSQTYKDGKSVKLLYAKLIKLSGGDPAAAQLIVEQSMANNWAGLFELKTTQNGTNTNGGRTNPRLTFGTNYDPTF